MTIPSDFPSHLTAMIEEHKQTGEIIDLWKYPPEDLWTFIDLLQPYDFFPVIEACERVLIRYIDRNSVIEMLIRAHQKKLQILQDKCLALINAIETGIRFYMTPVQYLSMEFFNYNMSAIEVFESLAPYVTHLLISGDLTNEMAFKTTINQCPQLITLDLSDSTQFSNYLEDLPPRIKELSLSRCRWINNQALQTIATVCPHLEKLDLSGNEQLTHGVWSELQKFHALRELDISRCFQVGDHELKILLKACPQLIKFSLSACQRISVNAFFEIGKSLSDLLILDISRTFISDAALIDLMMSCKNLYILDISRCDGLSDKGVFEGVKRAIGIKKILLKGCSGVTENSVERMKKHFPYVEFESV